MLSHTENSARTQMRCGAMTMAQGLHYAPHRFLSHSIPTSKIADSYLEVLEYVHSVSARPADDNQRLWAMRILDDLRQFRIWLLLAGTADILEVRMRC